MEKFLNWLAEHIVELIAFFVTSSFGGIVAFSLATYVREFWERNPLLTAFYTLLCLFAGIGIGIAINLSKYLIFKRELEEKARKCAEEEAKQKRRKERELKKAIKDARERAEMLSFSDRKTIKDLFEKGSQRTHRLRFEIAGELFYIQDLIKITETGVNECVVSLNNTGKFCAEHSQDILDRPLKAGRNF